MKILELFEANEPDDRILRSIYAKKLHQETGHRLQQILRAVKIAPLVVLPQKPRVWAIFFIYKERKKIDL